jgi:hypothetical protein
MPVSEQGCCKLLSTLDYEIKDSIPLRVVYAAGVRRVSLVRVGIKHLAHGGRVSIVTSGLNPSGLKLSICQMHCLIFSTKRWDFANDVDVMSTYHREIQIGRRTGDSIRRAPKQCNIILFTVTTVYDVLEPSQEVPTCSKYIRTRNSAL